jgi:hypothetical protein
MIVFQPDSGQQVLLCNSPPRSHAPETGAASAKEHLWPAGLANEGQLAAAREDSALPLL